jgi:hypothetical protein
MVSRQGRVSVPSTKKGNVVGAKLSGPQNWGSSLLCMMGGSATKGPRTVRCCKREQLNILGLFLSKVIGEASTRKCHTEIANEVIHEKADPITADMI